MSEHDPNECESCKRDRELQIQDARDKKAAQLYIARVVSRGMCFHLPVADRNPLVSRSWVYCSRCPAGGMDGELTHGAARRVCTLKKRYPK